MMKISIDGPKGSGKSTICESLRQKYDMRHEYISYKHNTLRDFTSVIEQFDVYTILYSSDHDLLRSRISNRQASTGKGFHLGEIEAFDLTMSNRMFECWGRIFSEDLGLNNVLLLDI